jgi:hypothetical protein
VKINLIESWLSVVKIPGMTTAQAIRDLNAELGTRYTPQDFGKWRRGARPIPQPVTDHMVLCSVGYALAVNGVDTLAMSDAQLDDIAARLTPPNV